MSNSVFSEPCAKKGVPSKRRPTSARLKQPSPTSAKNSRTLITCSSAANGLTVACANAHTNRMTSVTTSLAAALLVPRKPVATAVSRPLRKSDHDSQP